MRTLLWLRADLRVRDNPALYHACDDSTCGVIAVFVICPAQWQEHDWSAARVDLILRCLGELQGELQKLNIPLLIHTEDRFADVPGALLTLARHHECDALYFNRELEVNETRRDAAATRAFESAGFEVRAFHDQTLVPPSTMRTGAGTVYTVFTPFRRALVGRLRREGLPELYGRPVRQPEVAASSDVVPQVVERFDSDGRSGPWPAGEAAAHRRLESFIEQRIRSYADSRDRPDIDGTSGLSPYLALGVLSPRQCLGAAVASNRNRLSGGAKGPDTWISELIWREFYRHVLAGYPRVSMNLPFRLDTEGLPWRDDEPGYRAWMEGRTGVPIVDAAMRQLSSTGWMHNRLRMITAMFLTKDLLIDWRRGERHFMRQLVDGDLASNNGGWQWCASAGTDAAPYFRVFNPYRQSRRFDPDGAFIRRHVPELGDLTGTRIHEPSEAERRACGYPPPVVDHTKAARRAVNAFRELRESAHSR